MKTDIKYYPNGCIKYELIFRSDGSKWREQYLDEEGRFHNTCVPDYQSWHKNDRLRRKTYSVHGQNHNINNPADICFHENGKIRWKSYCFNNINKEKLTWINQIKNI